jgi:hypothetical protein
MILIGSVLAIAIFQKSGFEIPYLRNFAMNVTQSPYQFEVIAPDAIILPKPNHRTETKIGIKITNKTSQPRFFCLCPVEPKIVDTEGVQLVINPDIADHDMGFRRRDYKEIPAGKSYTYYSQASFSNQAGKIKFHFSNPNRDVYVSNTILSGEYSFSLRYSNTVDYFPASIYPGKSDSEIRGIWTGEIDIPSKKIRFASEN